MALQGLTPIILECVFGSWSGILMLIVLLLVTWQFYSNPARHAAPGPIYIPLIGYIPFLFGTKLGGKYFMELSRKYRSPIVSVRVCGQLMTMVNDHDLIKEVFVKRTDMADRSTKIADVMASLENFERDTNGIAFASGRLWQHQRRFILQMMRDFEIAKLSSENKIQFEASEAIEAFSLHNGQAFDPQHIIMMAISNITSQFLIGKRFKYTDESFRKNVNSTNEFMNMFGSPTSFLFPTRLGRWLFKSKFLYMRRLYEEITNYAREEIKEHISRFDGSVNDIIDAYLLEMETTNDKETCNENELTNLIRDFILGGLESTTTTLRWALLEMAIHQDVQDKVYNELSNVIRSGSVPSMAEKKYTPYTEAVLCEVHRFHTLTELGLPHANITDDIKINGYTIPRNTMLSANLFAIHHDRKFWKKPDDFYPDNFLDDQGNLAFLEKLIPFSIGRRSCACEALARTELYICFATWMKTFHVKLEADDTVSDVRTSDGMMTLPKPFSIRLILRPKLQ